MRSTSGMRPPTSSYHKLDAPRPAKGVRLASGSRPSAGGTRPSAGTRRPAAGGRTASGRPLMGAPTREPAAGRGASGRRSATGRGRRGLSAAASAVSGHLPTGGRLGLAFRAAVTVGVLALVAVIVLLVLSHLPVFVITGIDAQGSEHVTADTIGKLAAVDEGTTLLSVDVGKVQDNVKRNPWVKSVNVTREFPDRLGISVEERSVYAIVVIGSGSTVWSLGEDGAWIEPMQISPTDSGDLTEAALAKAQELGCLLISQVPSYVDPAQGSKATDDVIQAVLTYQSEFSQDLSSQVQTYNAASTGSLSMVLKSGLEVSLGPANDIASKQTALNEIMNTYPNQLTYVNVRVPSKPTYRKVSGDSYSAGTGLASANTGSAATTGSASTSSSASTSGASGSGGSGSSSGGGDASGSGDSGSGSGNGSSSGSSSSSSGSGTSSSKSSSSSSDT